MSQGTKTTLELAIPGYQCLEYYFDSVVLCEVFSTTLSVQLPKTRLELPEGLTYLSLLELGNCSVLFARYCGASISTFITFLCYCS